MVIVVVALLALVAFPRFISQISKAQRAQALMTLGSIRDVEKSYFSAYGSYTSTWPILVDFDGDGTNDVGMAQPSSAKFTFNVYNTGSYNTAYAEASSSDASYGFCLSSDKKSECPGASSCNPGCP